MSEDFKMNKDKPIKNDGQVVDAGMKPSNETQGVTVDRAKFVKANPNQRTNNTPRISIGNGR